LKPLANVSVPLVFSLALSACPPEPEPPYLAPELHAIHEEVFIPRCSASVCHGGTDPSAALDLQREPYANLVDVDADQVPGMKRVVPGDPEASLLYVVLLGPEGEVSQMPEGAELDAHEIEAIRIWIEDGAKDN
jgi:hypothetical protein